MIDKSKWGLDLDVKKHRYDVLWASTTTFPILEGKHKGRFLVLNSWNMGSFKAAIGNFSQGPSLRKNFKDLDIISKQVGNTLGPHGGLRRLLQEHDIPLETILDNPHMFYDRPTWGNLPQRFFSGIYLRLQGIHGVNDRTSGLQITPQMRAMPRAIHAEFMPHHRSYISEPELRFYFRQSSKNGSQIQTMHLQLQKEGWVCQLPGLNKKVKIVANTPEEAIAQFRLYWAIVS